MYTLVHHTADVRFHLRAATLPELFANGLRALTDFMQPQWMDEPAEARIELEALDATALLIDFLGEALTLCHVDHVAFDEVTFDDVSAGSLRATLRGRRVAAFEEDVKAVTYHEADVVLRDGEWTTNLVFDI